MLHELKLVCVKTIFVGSGGNIGSKRVIYISWLNWSIEISAIALPTLIFVTITATQFDELFMGHRASHSIDVLNLVTLVY